MRIKKFYYFSLFGFLILLSLSLACRFPSKAPVKPVETIAVSTEAVASLEEKVQNTIDQAAQGQTVELSLSEEEVTSLLAQKLSEQGEISFTDPQVYLRDDKVQMFGNVQSGKLKVSLQVVLEPKVDTSGKASLELISVNMGLISAPDSLVNTIQAQADQFLNEFLQKSGESFIVESITARDGLLTIRGHRP
jgi:uncharacterized protein YpmS